jgi:hypothetical protein
MSKGTRAVVVAAMVIMIAAVLAWVLKDGSIFTTSGSAAVLGKFVADAARDYPTPPKDG